MSPYLRKTVLLLFQSGLSMRQIANRTSLEVVEVEAIIRKAMPSP